MKRALVTGGSGDIGSAICEQLAESGLFVYVHAHKNPEKANCIVEKIRSRGNQAVAITFDITSEEAVNQAVNKILEEGAIQVLVNNAGIHDDAILAGMETMQWQKVLDVNLNGFFYVTRALLTPMMQTRWGRVINMSSLAGVMGNRGQANYSAAKAGLIGATKSLAQEMASRNITVNAIAPGVIAGDMTGDVFPDDWIKNHIPMKRAGTPGEVASLVAFLASDSAAYISGQVIGVNGAMA